MSEIFNNLYLTIYFALYFVLLFGYARKNGGIKNINATSFVILYYGVTTFFSILYYNACNGVYRDYSGITFPPFLYFFCAFLITLYPVYFFNKTIPAIKAPNYWQRKFFLYLTVLICSCSLLPFLESVLKIPNALLNDSISNAYQQRGYMSGAELEYLSFLGRKFFFIIWRLNNLIPILIFVQIIRNGKKKYIVLLCLSLVTIWIHAMVLGGRSKLVQNGLYVVFCFFVFKDYFAENVRRSIVKYGSIVLTCAVVAVGVVTISRFSAMHDTRMGSIWEWVGLYAGEGILNFNVYNWYVTKTINGYGTFGLPISLITGEKLDVAFFWHLGTTLGIKGSIFYTYVGTFLNDYGKVGALVVLFILALLTVLAYKGRIGSSIAKLTLICLCGKILLIGPIFYTYGSVDDQWNLLFALIVAYLL